VTLRIGGTKVRFNNRRRPNQGIHPTAAKAPVLDEIAIAPAHVQEKMKKRIPNKGLQADALMGAAEPCC